MNVAATEGIHESNNASIDAYSSKANSRKQYLFTILFSITSILLLTIFGVISFNNNNIVLGTVCLGFALLSVLNLLYLKITRLYRNACFFIVLLMATLTIYLICSGGTNNTGPLWFYIMPMLLFYVLELRHGLITLICLELLIALILLYPDNPLLVTSYSTDFTYRFLASLAAVSILSFAFEYTRQDWQREFINLSHLLERIARTDELTGLSNRRDMNLRLQEEAARFRHNRRVFCLIMGDIDHFKMINDQHGHDCGDNVLKDVAHLLHSEIKEQDTLCRWGGEEFLILLPETSKTKGTEVAERLRREILHNRFIYEDKEISLTMSMGVWEYNGTQSISDCLKNVDHALYLSKKKGRNCIS